jgi:hypothetical protein
VSCTIANAHPAQPTRTTSLEPPCPSTSTLASAVSAKRRVVNDDCCPACFVCLCFRSWITRLREVGLHRIRVATAHNFSEHLGSLAQFAILSRRQPACPSRHALPVLRLPVMYVSISTQPVTIPHVTHIPHFPVSLREHSFARSLKCAIPI